MALAASGENDKAVELVKALEQAALSAEQLLLSSRKSFQAGARTLSDVLYAEQQKQVTLRDLAQARYMYLISRIRLFALAGAGARDTGRGATGRHRDARDR